MQLHEPRHRLHRRRRVLQCLETFGRQLRAHHVVMMEGHLRTLEPTGGRLTDVVQQGSQTIDDIGLVAAGLLQVDGLLQHGQRVRVDVLVTHVLVAFQAQCRQLGQEMLGHPGAHQEIQALAGRVGEQ